MLYQPLFTVFGQPVYMYGVMIAVGIICCFWVLFSYAKVLGLKEEEKDFIFYNGIASIAVGFLGSAVWQGLFNYIDDVKNGEQATFSLNGGITAIGGLLSGALCFIVISIIFRKKYPYLLDKVVMFAPCCMTVAHAFGRLGCFFAGCCYGREVHSGDAFAFLAVHFPYGTSAYSNGNAIYPTQLFEAIFLFVLFFVTSILLLKKKFRYNMVVYLAAYGVWRFLIEFLRADYRGSFVGGLTPSQTQSLFLVISAVPVFFLIRYFSKKREAYEAEKANGRIKAETSDNDD